LDLESYWIDKIKTSHIGDDGAVIQEKVYAMDAFWEGTHFKREWMSIEQIAYKAFIVNLSDMVAMNATAKYMLLTVAFPKDIDKKLVKRLSSAISELANSHNIEIIGGDTIGSDKLGIVITMIGESKNPLKRDTVSSGDILAYTGVLGDVKKDLDRLFEKERIPDNSKFYRPILREDFIKAVTPWLSAGMDISDGLYCDTKKMLSINNLYMKELKVIPPEIGESGEEYEMLVAFSAENLNRVKRIAKLTNTPLTIFAKATVQKQESYNCPSWHF
jgi:thiamine-monophosphate kinase